MLPHVMPPSKSRAPRPDFKKTPRRSVKRVDPFSPWQLMVTDRMRELGINSRDLAAKITSGKRRFAHTTIWAWTKSQDGAPPKDTYTSEVNRKLAAAIEVSPDLLAQAYEDSRRHLIVNDRSAAVRGPLSILRRLISDSSQTTWTSAEIVKLIDDITPPTS